ncbi:MAG: hypothetical protein R3277_03310 [Brumimicrobium sp.]|nr:hypothetical protein [Brumimicrobium sp.]
MEKWLHQSVIDRKKWDHMVHQTENASVFCLSFYLDSTAEDWYAYTDEQFSFAIPVPVSVKLGIPGVYPPLFHREVSALGNIKNIDWNGFESALLKRFPRGTYQIKSNTLQKPKSKKLVYQRLNKEIYSLKSQARRQLKKFEESALTIKFGTDSAVLTEVIIRILGKKLNLNNKEGETLRNLVSAAEEKKILRTVGIFENEKLSGGLIALTYKNTTLYLKGACEEHNMEKGGMYAAMNALIIKSFEEGQDFDFGGSRVEGVRFFNTRFSGEDHHYFQYHWENGPHWFKLAQHFRTWIKKQS